MRLATRDDVEALVRLEAEAFADGAWGTEALLPLLTAPTPSDGPRESLVWLDEQAGGVAVYAAFQTVLDEAELLRVASRPSVRRRGLAYGLLSHALDELRLRGIDTCHLEVRADNDAALGLYRQLGFEPAGRRRGYYPDGTDALLLRRALGLPPDLEPSVS